MAYIKNKNIVIWYIPKKNHEVNAELNKMQYFLIIKFSINATISIILIGLSEQLSNIIIFTYIRVLCVIDKRKYDLY